MSEPLNGTLQTGMKIGVITQGEFLLEYGQAETIPGKIVLTIWQGDENL